MAKLSATTYAGLAEVLGNRDHVTIGKNTVARYDDDDIVVSLHGHDIVRLDPAAEQVSFTLAGWDTVTTRQRVNSFLGRDARVHREGGETFFYAARSVAGGPVEGRVYADEWHTLVVA